MEKAFGWSKSEAGWCTWIYRWSQYNCPRPIFFVSLSLSVLFCFVFVCLCPRSIWERMKRSLTNVYKAKVNQTLCYPFQTLANKVLQKNCFWNLLFFHWFKVTKINICLNLNLSLIFPEPFGLNIMETRNRIRSLKDHVGYLLSFRP